MTPRRGSAILPGVRYAWFGLASLFAAFLVFHLTFKIDRKCVVNANGVPAAGYGSVYSGRVFVPACSRYRHVLAFR